MAQAEITNFAPQCALDRRAAEARRQRRHCSAKREIPRYLNIGLLLLLLL